MKDIHKANVWIYNQSVRCAEKNMIPFELNKEELMSVTELPCMYCGEKPKNFRVSCVDRARPEIGFTKRNVVPACSDCIRSKGACDARTFVNRCLHISKMNGGPGRRTNAWSKVKYKSYEVYKAENHHKGFRLTEDEYYAIRNGKCNYCHRPTTSDHFNGIDRLDCDVGYIKENCVTCCIDCNLMKLVSMKEDFVRRMKKIASHVCCLG